MEQKDQEKVTTAGIRTAIAVVVRYVREHKKKIATLTVLSVLSAIGHGAIPFIIGRFFDSVESSRLVAISGYGIPLFAALLIVWAAVQSFSHLLDWKIITESERLSNIIWTDYISKGFGHILQLPMSFHKKHKIGEVGDKVNRAAQSLYEIVGEIVISLAPQFMSIVVALAIAFALQPTLALFLVAGTIAYIFIILISVKPLAKIEREYFIMLNKSFGDAYDSLGNALPVKQSNAERYEFEKVFNGFTKALPLYVRMKKIWEGLTLSQRLAALATQAAVLVLASVYIRSGAMSIGDLIAFFAYTTMIFEPFSALARNWQSIQNGIINIHETEKVLGLSTEAYAPKGSAPFTVQGDISFNDVSFLYDEGKPVLVDISFEAKVGDVIALVGESGVGKSTLIDLIGGYHFPTEGTVSIDGKDIKTLDLRSLRSQIAVVPQEVVLFNDTIKKNIMYGSFDASDAAVEEAARKAHAFDFISKFAHTWEQIVGERGVKLSVGQKQRIAIARAILRDPKILILDEPTAALDAGSEKIITESLESLMRGKTTFIVAHRLSTVRKADTILVFKEGRIVESGTHAELLAKAGGEYKRLYDLQIGLHD